jgi:DNA-binding IclR family transcriptional regulator
MRNLAPVSDERYVVPALMRGIQLLQQFNRSDRTLTGAELARRLHLPRASVFRLLQTLELAGLVNRCDDGIRYQLGPGMLRLGFEYLASLEITEVGRSIIEALRDDCGYSVHIVIRDGKDVVFVAKAIGESAVFHSIQIGARLPAHATVLGRILLGNLDRDGLQSLYGDAELRAYTDTTPTTLDQLYDRIRDDLQRGYAISESGFESGISTIAAPVFDDSNRIVAAVSIDNPRKKKLLGKVLACANDLSEQLSHRDSTPTLRRPLDFKSKVA